MIERYPGAIWLPGPPNKAGGYSRGDRGPKRGEVKHSAVGSWDGMQGVLFGPRASSWQFSILKPGTVFQHYDVSVYTWHGNDTDSDGDIEANFDLVGTEHEGGPPGNESEPLTPEQVQASIDLSRWLAQTNGFNKWSRYPDQSGWVLAEHNQVGNSPTACPSGRIPWDVILAALNETERDLPTTEQAAHAIGFLYPGFWAKDRSTMHAWDLEIIDRIIRWYKGDL